MDMIGNGKARTRGTCGLELELIQLPSHPVHEKKMAR